MSEGSIKAGKVQHHIVGGGIAGLAVAVFLIRDAGVDGNNIRIYEQLDVSGGSLDGSGDAETGYLVRGGRMFEEHFACTFGLLETIPSVDDPRVSVKDDIFAFNRQVPGFSNCRIVKNGRPSPDRDKLLLGIGDIVSINRLILSSETSLASKRIEEWFNASFFESNFWLMWSTMFSFQPWHSLVEMRRYFLRFIHLLPGFTRIAGVLRTRYNQYDSVIMPLLSWLQEQHVQLMTRTQVIDVTIESDVQGYFAAALRLGNDTTVKISKSDEVYLTLGSMTDGSVFGTNTQAPLVKDDEGGAWKLWRKLAQNYEGFGNPQAFCSQPDKTAWNSFTVTLDSPNFFEFMEKFTRNRTGTGGLVTFAGSGWVLSIVLFHQPHFCDQSENIYTFWGYGLRGDRCGDFVKKPMWKSTGDEIISELSGHLGLNYEQSSWLERAIVRPCRMPFITSQFMPRKPGERPNVRPAGAQNFAIIGQYTELPDDCVFTVEYSVRSAQTAVSELTGLAHPPPPVKRSYLQPMVLLRAARVLMGL